MPFWSDLHPRGWEEKESFLGRQVELPQPPWSATIQPPHSVLPYDDQALQETGQLSLCCWTHPCFPFTTPLSPSGIFPSWVPVPLTAYLVSPSNSPSLAHIYHKLPFCRSTSALYQGCPPWFLPHHLVTSRTEFNRYLLGARPCENHHMYAFLNGCKSLARFYQKTHTSCLVTEHKAKFPFSTLQPWTLLPCPQWSSQINFSTPACLLQGKVTWTNALMKPTHHSTSPSTNENPQEDIFWSKFWSYSDPFSTFHLPEITHDVGDCSYRGWNT